MRRFPDGILVLQTPNGMLLVIKTLLSIPVVLKTFNIYQCNLELVITYISDFIEDRTLFLVR